MARSNEANPNLLVLAAQALLAKTACVVLKSITMIMIIMKQVVLIIVVITIIKK